MKSGNFWWYKIRVPSLMREFPGTKIENSKRKNSNYKKNSNSKIKIEIQK